MNTPHARFILAGTLAIALLLLGLLGTTALFTQAQVHGGRVEATRMILLESMSLQREVVEGLQPSRYLSTHAESAIQRLSTAMTALQAPGTTLQTDARWMRLQIAAIGETRQRYHASSNANHRNFLRALLSLLLSELTESAEILHRTAVGLRSQALTTLYAIGAGVLIFAVLCVLAILVQYLRSQHQRDLYTRHLDEVNRRLRSYTQELESYLYISSHDLKEPLRSISVFGELLQRDIQQQDYTHSTQHLATIRSNAQRMRELIDGLMELAMLDRRPQAPTSVAAQREIESLKALLAAQLVAAGGSIAIGELPEVQVDRLRFRSVMENLLTNAIRYRDPDRPLRIQIDAQREDGAWRFDVTDTGRGIDPDQQREIFQLYRRLHSREISGTGVGLALCKKCVEQWGGRIWVDSRPGTGSTFSFTVPDPARYLRSDAPQSHTSRTGLTTTDV